MLHNLQICWVVALQFSMICFPYILCNFSIQGADTEGADMRGPRLHTSQAEVVGRKLEGAVRNHIQGELQIKHKIQMCIITTQCIFSKQNKTNKQTTTTILRDLNHNGENYVVQDSPNYIVYENKIRKYINFTGPEKDSGSGVFHGVQPSLRAWLNIINENYFFFSFWTLNTHTPIVMGGVERHKTWVTPTPTLKIFWICLRTVLSEKLLEQKCPHYFSQRATVTVLQPPLRQLYIRGW